MPRATRKRQPVINEPQQQAEQAAPAEVYNYDQNVEKRRFQDSKFDTLGEAEKIGMLGVALETLEKIHFTLKQHPDHQRLKRDEGEQTQHAIKLFNKLSPDAKNKLLTSEQLSASQKGVLLANLPAHELRERIEKMSEWGFAGLRTTERDKLIQGVNGGLAGRLLTTLATKDDGTYDPKKFQAVNRDFESILDPVKRKDALVSMMRQGPAGDQLARDLFTNLPYDQQKTLINQFTFSTQEEITLASKLFLNSQDRNVGFPATNKNLDLLNDETLSIHKRFVLFAGLPVERQAGYLLDMSSDQAVAMFEKYREGVQHNPGQAAKLLNEVMQQEQTKTFSSSGTIQKMFNLLPSQEQEKLFSQPNISPARTTQLFAGIEENDKKAQLLTSLSQSSDPRLKEAAKACFGEGLRSVLHDNADARIAVLNKMGGDNQIKVKADLIASLYDPNKKPKDTEGADKVAKIFENKITSDNLADRKEIFAELAKKDPNLAAFVLSENTGFLLKGSGKELYDHLINKAKSDPQAHLAAEKILNVIKNNETDPEARRAFEKALSNLQSNRPAGIKEAIPAALLGGQKRQTVSVHAAAASTSAAHFDAKSVSPPHQTAEDQTDSPPPYTESDENETGTFAQLPAGAVSGAGEVEGKPDNKSEQPPPPAYQDPTLPAALAAGSGKATSVPLHKSVANRPSEKEGPGTAAETKSTPALTRTGHS